MKIIRRHRRLLLGMALITATATSWAQQTGDWPNRPIRMVVSAAPGSGTDIWARMLGDQLGRRLGQPLVIDNKPGASGVIANDTVAKSKPDGYTILYSNASSTVMLQALQPKLPYDLLRDLAPVAQIGAGGVFLAVAADFPASNMKEFVAEVKAHPDRYTYATWGIGSSAHLIMEGLKNRTGVSIDHVPYKSVTQILNDLQGGMLKVAFVDTTSSLPFARAKKIKLLGVSGSRRVGATPDVPTLTEQGYKFDTDGWYGVFVPIATPAPIVARLNAEINRFATLPELRERFRQFNMSDDPPTKTPEQFTQTVRSDIATWSSIVKTNNISAD